jgi:flavin-dependent dehydrogenase
MLPNRPLYDLPSEEMLRRSAALDDLELLGHPVHWFSPFSRLSVPRVILVGDAAGAVGIFGENISFTLGSNRVAVETITHAFARSDFSFSDYQRRILRSLLRGRAATQRKRDNAAAWASNLTRGGSPSLIPFPFPYRLICFRNPGVFSSRSSR